MIHLNTLSRDNRKRKFGFIEYNTETHFFTGKNYDKKVEASFILSENDINIILEHFKDKGWFILGNQVDDVKPNGFGSFYKDALNGSPKNTSHISSYLQHKDLIISRIHNGCLELKIK